MKKLFIIAVLAFVNSANAQDLGQDTNIWGQKHSQKEPLFNKPVHNCSKEYKKQQEAREKADAIVVAKNKTLCRNYKVVPHKVVPPLSNDEIHYLDMVRANQIRECRLLEPLTNFDILVRHRWDPNFGSSTLGYRVLNGNAW